jgi:hypothetical protein
MSDYRKQGQAMRRRAGAASNHMDGAGKKTSVEIPSNLEAMIAGGSARIAVGEMRGTLIPKKGTQSADPTVMGAKPRRTPVKVDASSAERLSAKHSITAKMPTIDPAAGATMANARIVPSTMGARQGFSGGASDSMR